MTEPVAPMPCVLCDKPLESVNERTWSGFQPYGGCEMQIIGSYGSRKFDDGPGTTTYQGVICDECAEKLVGKMVGPSVTGLNGQTWTT